MQVGVDGDDFGSCVGCDFGVGASIAADVEYVGWVGAGENCGDEAALCGVVLFAVVGGGAAVVRPLGGVGRGMERRCGFAQIGQSVGEDVFGDVGVVELARRCAGGAHAAVL